MTRSMFYPDEQVEWNHDDTDMVCTGIVKSVSQNGRIVFIRITWPAPGKYITLDADQVRLRSES